MLSQSLKTKLLFLLACCCLVLFFIDGPGYESVRSFKHAWDLGHIFTFGLWAYLFFRTSKWINQQAIAVQLCIVVTLAVVLGALIEAGQAQINSRTSDVFDIRRDVVGVLFALFFLTSSRFALSFKMRRGLQILVIALILFEAYPMARALADETIARQQFPMLAGFETPFELDRFHGSAAVSRDESVARDGRYSLQVALTTAQYSGISLHYFPRDWRGYQGLGISVYNPLPQGLTVTCRVHDVHHKSHGNRYSDRFNARFELETGWNDLEVPMAALRKAPLGRQMDLSEITGVGLFVTNLPAPRVIYVDTIRLIP